MPPPHHVAIGNRHVFLLRPDALIGQLSAGCGRGLAGRCGFGDRGGLVLQQVSEQLFPAVAIFRSHMQR